MGIIKLKPNYASFAFQNHHSVDSISAFAVGFYSLYSNPKSKAIWLWFLANLAVGLWGIGLLMIVVAKDYSQAMFFDSFLHCSSAFIPIFFLHFVLTFLHLQSKIIKYFIALGYALAAFFSVIAWFPPLLVSGASARMGFNFWVDGGVFYVPFAIQFFAYAFVALLLLLIHYRQSDGIIKKQIFYMLLAASIGFILGGTSFLPQLFNIYPFGNFFTFLYPLLITYGIFLK